MRGLNFENSERIWWRRIQKYPRLRYAFTRKEKKGEQQEIQLRLQQFFSLSYLPPEHVTDAFNQLAATGPNFTCATSFVNYIRRNYIDSKVFPPNLWASPLTHGDCKTTNGVESYNSKLRGEFYYHHPNVYEATQQIFTAQSLVTLKIRSARNNEVFRKRSDEEKRDDEIIVVTESLKSQDLDLMSFLEMIRSIKYDNKLSDGKCSSDNEDGIGENSFDNLDGKSDTGPDCSSDDEDSYYDSIFNHRK